MELFLQKQLTALSAVNYFCKKLHGWLSSKYTFEYDVIDSVLKNIYADKYLFKLTIKPVDQCGESHINLSLSWSLSYKNQCIYLLSKSMD